MSATTEQQAMDELYAAARAEGGRLVVYAGGDAPGQAGLYTAGFSERFPGIDVEVTVDLSKYHNARVDGMHLRGDNRADVVHVQTLYDFPYWKEQGLLMPYRPLGLEHVDPAYVDPDGTYYALFAFAFSNVVDTAVIPEERAPREATDYLRPEFEDRIVLTYPHDDDAVLYQFEQIIARHGHGWLEKLLAQNPLWVRGTATPLEVIASGERGHLRLVLLPAAAGGRHPALPARPRGLLPVLVPDGRRPGRRPAPRRRQALHELPAQRRGAAGLRPVARAHRRRHPRLAAAARVRQHQPEGVPGLHGRPRPRRTGPRRHGGLHRPGHRREPHGRRPPLALTASGPAAPVRLHRPRLRRLTAR
ncbi:ABC transporter substrate-binding protein [Streptomyces filamentosus]|uniref:ABC transporter substrate-binding protein n=1 Tax=Streptomyces filamentosus TaxID=67294 RepID=UPI0036E07B39